MLWGSSIRIQSGANGTFGAIKFRLQQGVVLITLIIIITSMNGKIGWQSLPLNGGDGGVEWNHCKDGRHLRIVLCHSARGPFDWCWQWASIQYNMLWLVMMRMTLQCTLSQISSKQGSDCLQLEPGLTKIMAESEDPQLRWYPYLISFI